MHQATPSVNSRPQERALSLLREANGRGMTARELGDAIGTDHTTVNRWMRGTRQPTGAKLQLLLEWADRQSEPAPSSSQEFQRGVLYACEAMSQTITRLLREQREATEAIIMQTAKATLAGSPPAAAPSRPKTPPANPRTVARSRTPSTE